MMTTETLIANSGARFENLVCHYLENATTPASRLQQAMLHTVRTPGKRIRPQLVYLSGFLLNAEASMLDAPAAAVELIHTYSLIHDDLPAMDNADLRRGQPTCHMAFDTATAILAGDALQPLAFEILATHPSSLQPDQRIQMINTLSRVSGFNGMAAGQMLDLQGASNLETLIALYRLKTGALLGACAQMGIIAARTPCEWLLHFTDCIGLAFQIQDDILDTEGQSVITGKPEGLDSRNQKINYPALCGLAASQQKVSSLFESACQDMPFTGHKKQLVHSFVHELMERKK